MVTLMSGLVMKLRILWTAILFMIVLMISCVAVITTSPKQRNLTQRLESFPTANLPLKDSATIYWNTYLIPFIDARNDEDCAFLLGMVHAHLRLAQMTIFRRVAEGRLAESAGPFATSIDHSLRIINFGAAVDSIEKELPLKTRSWLQNFVNGINFYQDNMVDIPVELKLLNLQPEPWEIKDILRLGRLASADVNWFNWFQWLKLREKPYWDQLWTRFLDLGFQSTPSFSTNAAAFDVLINSGIKSGSNAVAISASCSADGNAILASDPHLGLQLPNWWLIAGYQCPSFQVVGLMFPGAPMILVGRNRFIAWGGTNMRSASSDLYELNSEQFQNIKSRNEKIKVRWWKDKEVEVRTSEWGPIISDAPLFKAKEGQTLSIKWVGYQITDEFTSFMKLNQATNWTEFQYAFEGYGVSGQNFLYADTEGHIGMVAAVKIPDRSQVRPDDFILNPDNPQHNWNGIIGSNDLPSIFDPEEGFIVSANNRPFIHNPPIGYFFSANDRVDRLKELFQKNDQIDLDYVKKTQVDVFVPSAIKARNALIEKMDSFNLCKSSDQKGIDFFTTLNEWDGNYHVNSKGAVAFQMLVYHFVQDYYTKIFDEDIAKMLFSSEHVNIFLQQDLANGEATLLKGSLENALFKAIKDFHQFKNWGKMHRLKLSHPLGRIPLIGRKFRFGDYPAEGSYNSLTKTAHNISNKRHETFYGANSRFIAMMKDLDENYFVLLGGQDGWLGSDHFIDQVPLWLKGEYIQIPLRIESVRESFSYQIQLEPAKRY